MQIKKYGIINLETRPFDNIVFDALRDNLF